jgi:hypothetical protein
VYSGAAAFFYPSLLEGFGLPIVEAMACGTPVITSNNSALKEVAADSAILVDPRSVHELTEALARVSEDAYLRQQLSAKGLKRAAQFSWDRTAELTIAAYREVGGYGSKTAVGYSPPCLQQLRVAVEKTVAYAKLFQYPLTPDEIRERLFDVEIDKCAFRDAWTSLGYESDKNLLAVRQKRERISDEAIREIHPHLCTLASMPFVRMIAFSGATAHRNMNTAEDIDLFMIVEDGKLWAVYLIAILWARTKGIRHRLCMNYLISDAGLPLYEHDAFTAQQAASLKPVFGKAVYDRFIAANPFVIRSFPNFDVDHHRQFYPEIAATKSKRIFEAILRIGPIQILERLSRFALHQHLRRKSTELSDIQLDARRLKLHTHSHKRAILRLTDQSPFRVRSLQPQSNVITKT